VCVSCGLEKHETFLAEIAIHARSSYEPLVFVFPSILVCMNCGKPEFAEKFFIPNNELGLLSKRGG